MKLKHKVRINVTDDVGNKQTVLQSGISYLPRKLARWLFGENTEVLVLKPGQSVDSVEIREMGGKANEQN